MVDPRIGGMLAGELLAGFVPAGSRVAVITGMLSTEDHARKISGFYEVFPRECAGGSIAEVVEGHEDETESYEKSVALLRGDPGLAGLYVNTANSLPVCRALRETGRAGKVRLITTDLYPELVPYFRDRTIAASIYQRPYRQGQLAVRLLVDHFANGVPLPRLRQLSPAVVMRSNLSLFREAARPRLRGEAPRPERESVAATGEVRA